jgi:hypothetical protein
MRFFINSSRISYQSLVFSFSVPPGLTRKKSDAASNFDCRVRGSEIVTILVSVAVLIYR